MKTHDDLTLSRRAAIETELGFDLPPYRLPYKSFRTDYGIGSVGLHWIIYTMHLPAYQATRFHLAAVAELDSSAVEIVLQKGLIESNTPVTDNYHELLERDDFALIDSCFGHNRHLQKIDKKVSIKNARRADAAESLVCADVPHQRYG